jgi:hypothetical protein
MLKCLRVVSSSALYREYTCCNEAFVKLGSILLKIQKRYPNDRAFGSGGGKCAIRKSCGCIARDGRGVGE